MGDSSALATLAEDNLALSREKQSILVSHGYPAEYLTPQYTCPICRDTGFVDGERCSCFKQALSKLIYSESNIMDVIERENFSTFRYDVYSDDPADTDPFMQRTPRENIREVVASAQDFIRSFDTAHSNLLVYGNTGVGKTFLLNCIAKELLDSAHTVLYYTAFGFFDYLEKCKFRSGDSEEIISVDHILDCDLLIIDDLGTELDTQFSSFALYSVINERALRGHSTVISTNLALDELAPRYSERVFSRFNKDYRFLKIIGEDIRCM